MRLNRRRIPATSASAPWMASIKRLYVSRLRVVLPACHRINVETLMPARLQRPRVESPAYLARATNSSGDRTVSGVMTLMISGFAPFCKSLEKTLRKHDLGAYKRTLENEERPTMVRQRVPNPNLELL